LSHILHNECAITSSSFGECEHTPWVYKKKHRDDDGILSALPMLIPAMLDDLIELVNSFPGLLEFLARQEGVPVLRLPATGVDLESDSTLSLIFPSFFSLLMQVILCGA
jgi:hypothetical protein